MTTDELRKLALSATINGPDATLFIRPQTILAMIAVIDAAKAMRDAYVKAWRTDDPKPASVATFDASLAAKIAKGGDAGR